MPEMDGLRATQLIRNHPIHGTVPIIGLTADAFVSQHAALRNVGMDAIVTKPFTDHELMSVIWKIIPSIAETTLSETPAAAETDWRTTGEIEFWDFAHDRNPELILQLLDLARSTTTERVIALQAAIDDGDAAQIHFAAHTIKGSAGTLFASRLSELADGLEIDHQDLEKIRGLLPGFVACVQETLAWWDKLETAYRKSLK